MITRDHNEPAGALGTDMSMGGDYSVVACTECGETQGYHRSGCTQCVHTNKGGEWGPDCIACGAKMRVLTPLRGRVVIREVFEDSSTLWTPTGNPRERLTHRGVVLALGPPALTPLGAEVPYDYEVGATVQFHFTATEKGRIAPWTDGKPALWMAWFEIDAVIEPDGFDVKLTESSADAYAVFKQVVDDADRAIACAVLGVLADKT